MKLTPYITLALAMVGIGDTLFLSYYAFINVIPGCALKGCEIVLSSPYSHVLGIPMAYLGLVYYTYMFALAILLMIEPQSRALRLGALVYTGIGLALSLVFEFYIQLGIIHALCMYCAISATTTLLLFATAVWHWRTTRVSTPAA
jgi:uncharacterized membrane protein